MTITCFQCLHPEKYTVEAYRWLKDENLLCDEHLVEAERVILEEKPEPKKYELKTGPAPKQERSFYEREREVGEEG